MGEIRLTRWVNKARLEYFDTLSSHHLEIYRIEQLHRENLVEQARKVRGSECGI